MLSASIVRSEGYAVIRILLCIALSTMSAAVPGQQDWPSRPVKFVVPTPPGGGTDLYARLLAQSLSESLKQPFVVENRPGAGGNIGADLVAKASPDGYTFLVSASGTVVVNPVLYKNFPFNPERDLVPVAGGVTGPLVFIIHPGLPFRDLRDLLAAARSHEGKLSFGSAGTGSMSYLGVRKLEEAAKVRFFHVPYKGMGQAYQDLIGGQVNFLFADVASALGHIRAGKVRALGVTMKTPLLPGIPTVAEGGVEGFDVSNSFSVFAPGGTPASVVERANNEIARAMQSTQLLANLEAQAMVPVFQSPAEFAAHVRRERSGWATFIARTGITLEQ
jgi:tripartite-type tricarboxylate transporter receptor subunit TctC